VSIRIVDSTIVAVADETTGVSPAKSTATPWIHSGNSHRTGCRRAVAVAELQRLVSADRYGEGSSDPGVLLLGAGVLEAIQTGLASKPEIPIERRPKPGLHIVAQVSFKRANGFAV